MPLHSIRYVLVEEHLYSPETGPYHSYGIMALHSAGDEEKRLLYVPDVSTDRDAAAGLARRCTCAELSPVHLREVLMDALG